MVITAKTLLGDPGVLSAPARAVLAAHHLEASQAGVSLEEACAAHGLPLAAIMAELEEAELKAWRAAPLEALLDHLLEWHHGYAREEIASLRWLTAQVVASHGCAHPAYAEVEKLLGKLMRDLEGHMAREEREIFPKIRQLAKTGGPLTLAPPEGDWDGLLPTLSALRKVTRDYTPAAGDCARVEVLLAGLENLEAVLLRHEHLEEKVLAPRARALAGARS